MATAYQFTGEQPMDYPQYGFSVQPGDVVCLDGTPPTDGLFQAAATPAAPAPDGTDPVVHWLRGEVKRPNKAASAADWSAYALAQGMPPDEVQAATRAALVAKYSDPPAEQPPADTAPATADTAAAAPAEQAPADTTTTPPAAPAAAPVQEA